MRRLPWTDAEVAALRAGGTALPGRTAEAIKSKRRELGLLLRDARPTWTAAELDALRTGMKSLPGRTADAVKCMRKCLGLRVRGPQRPWSEVELAALQSGAIEIAGRTPASLRCRRKSMYLPSLGRRAWSPEEVALLKAGHREIAGRTEGAVRQRMRKLELVEGRGSRWRWTGVEIALLRSGEVALEGRSRRAVNQKRDQLGLVLPTSRAIIVRPNDRTGSVLAAASPQAPGRILIQRIQRLLPTWMDAGLKAEVLSEATLLALEEGLSPEEAVRRATPQVRRFVGEMARHRPIDTCFFL